MKASVARCFLRKKTLAGFKLRLLILSNGNVGMFALVYAYLLLANPHDTIQYVSLGNTFFRVSKLELACVNVVLFRTFTSTNYLCLILYDYRPMNRFIKRCCCLREMVYYA